MGLPHPRPAPNRLARIWKAGPSPTKPGNPGHFKSRSAGPSRRSANHPIDRFLEKTRREKGLKAAPRPTAYPAAPRVHGPDRPAAHAGRDAGFLADKSPNAWERLIDKLLASPHYGERWGRHWLDVARYADSNGFEHDFDRPNAWRYRDYVIRAFNKDTPYNVFLPSRSPATSSTGSPKTASSPPAFCAATPRSVFAKRTTRSSATSTWTT